MFSRATSTRFVLRLTVAALLTGPVGCAHSPLTDNSDAAAAAPLASTASPEAADAQARVVASGPAPAAPQPATPTPTPPPPPRADFGLLDTKTTETLKKSCEALFPDPTQGEPRLACVTGIQNHKTGGKAGALTFCRTTYTGNPRAIAGCMVGTALEEELSGQAAPSPAGGWRARARLCLDHYPAYSILDIYLQEGCFIGVSLPALLGQKANLAMCQQLSSERAFTGPCGVGLTLSGDPLPVSTPPPETVSQQNKMCMQYFDFKQFHTGYRACLNARSLALNWTGKFQDILRECSNIVSDNGSDTERAACVVGVSIFKSMGQTDGPAARFQACGDSKVTYRDRDFLACLTAASLLTFGKKDEARKGCQEIYTSTNTTGRKSKRRARKAAAHATVGRQHCLRALDQL